LYFPTFPGDSWDISFFLPFPLFFIHFSSAFEFECNDLNL
jgi:hypothetical protein